MQEHAIAVILLLLGVIVLLLAAFALYLRMKSKNKELSRQAFRDSLIKVGNRAGYAAKEKELQKAMDADGAPDFALVMMDVNGLKRINSRAQPPRAGARKPVPKTSENIKTGPAQMCGSQ